MKNLGASRIRAQQSYVRTNRLGDEDSENADGAEASVHGRDGKIRDADTVKPGNDRFLPRDKK